MGLRPVSSRNRRDTDGDIWHGTRPDGEARGLLQPHQDFNGFSDEAHGGSCLRVLAQGQVLGKVS